MKWPLILVAIGCTSKEEPAPHAGTDADPSYALDEVLGPEDMQVIGTHNSYHVQTTDLPAHAYTHRPLDEQLGELGVRQFELDIFFRATSIDVVHLPAIDEGVTCGTLIECVELQASWSEENPWHLPIMTLIEPKTSFDDELGHDAVYAEIDQILRDAWGDRLFTPADLLGDAETLPEAIATDGWPRLAELRGKAIYVFHDGGSHRDAYLAAGLSTLASFPDAKGDMSQPYASIHSMNDPTNPAIADVIGAGHLVRTRADADVVEPQNNDTIKRDAALASGAHFISTDFPEPHPETGYVVETPGDGTARCNPILSKPECTNGDLE